MIKQVNIVLRNQKSNKWDEEERLFLAFLSKLYKSSWLIDNHYEK